MTDMAKIYYIAFIIITIIYVVSARKLAKSSFRKGWQFGSKQAVEWLTIALAKSGFNGKQLQDILTLIAGHLNELKKEQEQPDAKQEGGVTEGQ
jgi:hypothetical protein